MRYHRVVIAFAAASFAGCSSSGSQLTPARSQADQFVSQAPVQRGLREWAASKPVLFVSDLQGNVVRMYDPNTPNPTSEGEITDGVLGPQGLAVDAKGSLYVSNVGYPKSWIAIYSKGASKPRTKIYGPGYYGLAVDSKGNIFCAYTGGYLDAYKPGAKKPYETISGFDNLDGVAVDSKNNVWVADIGASKVYTIAAGTKTAKDAGLQQLNGPGGIAFGEHDVLYVGNFGPYDVTVYKSGEKKPEYTITDGITGPNLNGVTAKDYFFQANQEHDVVGYKKGKTVPFSTIVGNSDPLGIASFPLVKK